MCWKLESSATALLIRYAILANTENLDIDALAHGVADVLIDGYVGRGEFELFPRASMNT